MKLIEPNPKKIEKDRFQQYVDQIKQVLPIGRTGEQAEEAIVARFLRGLDNRFVMLRNLQLEGQGVPFPAILVGPAGMAVLNISREQGFFRVKEDSWWKMDKTTHRFNPARPNLIRQSQDFAKKLAAILDMHAKAHPEVIPVLIFANPGVHIESSNPAIRIILMDGVERLITDFLKNEEVLQPNEIYLLSDALEVMANPEKAIPMGEGEDFFGKDLFTPEKKPPPKRPSIPIPTEISLRPVEEKLRLTRKQWTLLVGMLLLTIVVLLVVIVYVLSTI